MAMINHELFFFTPKLIYGNILYAYSLEPNHLYQIVIFVFSLMMLSGNMSFYPSIFFYVYMSFLLINIFYNKRNHVELNKHICDIYIGLSSVIIFSALIPQLSHFRYYLFLVPPILALFTVRYSAKHLFLLTFVAFTYNTVGLNIMNHL